MAEKIIISSIDTDNRITAQFSDKYLPRVARHGELYVVNGILYIYADLDSVNQGRWFPLTDQKEIYAYDALEISDLWEIPIDFHTENIEIIVYDHTGKIFTSDYMVYREDNLIKLGFENAMSGQVHIIVNKAFDWIDRRLIVGDRNFSIYEDETDPNIYYVELDTEFIQILRDGNITFKQNLDVHGLGTFNKIMVTDIHITGLLESENINQINTKLTSLEMELGTFDEFETEFLTIINQ